MTKKEQVRDKIVEVCPDVVKNKNAQLIHFDHTVEYFVEYHPITLAHVLRAITKEEEELLDQGFAMNSGGDMTELVRIDGVISQTKEPVRWNLTKPFEEQSDEVIEFLATILLNV